MTGHRFSVWAPDAGGVEVVLGDGRRLGMQPDDQRPSEAPGWWAVEVAEATPGTDYGFSLDGGPVRPDPRSMGQPAGPDGLSRLVDTESFPWTDGAWTGAHLPAGVIYELHIGTFTPDGTFGSAVAKLDHLVDLGVTLVELMPVAEFPGPRGWGYDGVDLYAPHHHYGGPKGLVELVDACHARGLGVILDVVYNHLGPAGNHLGEFGPYFTDRYSTPWGQALNLDGPGSDEVRRFFIDNAVMWLRDYHFDGLRLDAVHAIVDTSATHLLEELSAAVTTLSAQIGRRLFLIAESDLNDPRVVTPRMAGGFGMDAQWSDDFHHALHAVMTGETSGYYSDFGTMEDLATAMRHAFVYDGRHSRHRRRRHGRRPEGLPGWSFIGYLQNHDQIGNRAVGERSSALMSPGRLKAAAAVVLCAPFVPMLFQGEEWAASTPFQYFTSHPDPDLGRAVSEGRRSEFASFGWDPSDVPGPQDAATFERSKLDWSELGAPPHDDLLRWHRDLISLRRGRPELTDGRLDSVEVEHGEDWLSLRRGDLVLVLNIGQESWTVPLAGADARLLLASEEKVTLSEEGVELPPDSVAVVAIGAIS